MSEAGRTAGPAVHLAEPAGGAGPPDVPAVLGWFAREFDRPFSAAAVLARLPGGLEVTDLDALARMLGTIGLRARIVLRDPARLDPAVLPCVLDQRDGGPLILTGLDRKAGLAGVTDPETGVETEIRLRDLRRRIATGILLVTRDTGATRGASSDAARDRHWFWGPVRANAGGWAQLFVAALLLNLLSLALPLFVMNVYDKVIPNLAFVTLWTLALGVGIALALDLVLRLIRTSLLDRIGRRVDLAVAASLFRQAMGARLLSRPGGAAGIAATIRDFETVREFFASASFVAVIDLAFVGVFIAVLFLIVGPIALVPLLALPAILVLAGIAQIPIARAAGRAQEMSMRRQTVLAESLSGIETVKSLGAEPVMQREWESAVAASAQVGGRVRFWSAVATNGTMLIQQGVSVAIIVWGVFLVSDGRITIGGLIAANILAARILAPMGLIAQTLFRAQYAFISLAALNRFMALPVDQPRTVAHDLRPGRGAVELRDVTLTFPDARSPALDGLSLSVEPGEIVALLGKVGSGKSTTGKVIAGLIAPDAGTVLVDGIALDQYDPAELRAGIGYLPQEPELFTGTLRENLVLGAPGAPDARVMRALYFAGLDETVAALPDGLDHYVGEQGARLSGGQRQAVALARLILRAPRLLFLDEPTNAMDQAMEAGVIARLRELNAGGTGLVISTHRQSLAAIAGRLVVLDRGRAVLDGPRAEVLARLQGQAAERVRG
ncbi:ATP-binding cassette, subfamily C, LapB [Cribrihabitans marinus]|uniref:ATP-binding cassette, subfamily C, LapB n=1 Tax=Cribrihabitans marinus TaxID=1227549 RepID=A0A1H7AU28_9RHOB|nr:type I secretion system permease/ATPase [Cribrihabitans marinus]GGH32486.1 peptide ABC transporter ATP-binidng protein [Cribrihabitans marinus]SEJ68798.1 ATP-binding cassette, subfamily C, LapB [Cribrihabitans marinus]